MSENGVQERRKTTYLVVDIGHSHTTAALFDVVAGSFRLIARADAPTTTQPPILDVGQGIRHAIQTITHITGRLLLNNRGDLIRPSRRDGSGVDFYTMVVSAAEPLQTTLAGLFSHVSIRSARHVLAATYSNEINLLSLDDRRPKDEQISQLISDQPDLIMIAGGTDGGAQDRLLEIVDTVSIATGEADQDWRPAVVFAGNEAVKEVVESWFREDVPLTLVTNVRPKLDEENLSEGIGIVSELYRTLKINTMPGIRDILTWCHALPISSANAFAAMVRHIAIWQDAPVFGIDLGSLHTTLITASPEHTKTAVHTNLGTGANIRTLFPDTLADRINHWLPSALDEAEILDFIYNRALYPHTVAIDEKEILLEFAIARELIGHALAQSAERLGWKTESGIPPASMLIARGSLLTHAPRLGQTILVLLDALQPSGVFSVALDQHNVLTALGATTAEDPLVAIQAIEKGALPHLGWVIAPTGRGKPEQRALTIRLESKSAKLPEIEVEYGSIELLPLPAGETAKVTIIPARNFDVGVGPGRSMTLPVEGGLLGLIIDARGRPFSLPAKESERQNKIRQWLRDVGG